MNYAQGFADIADIIEVEGAAVNMNCRVVGTVVFLLCLVIAARMDDVCQEVYNLLWVPPLAVWSLCCVERIMVFGASEGRKGLLQLLLFMTLQQLLFSRFYGRADCHAFSCCAAYLWIWNRGIYSYLFHMLCALGLLALMQGIKGNISASGNLKTPVAFIPYIAAAYFPILILQI